MSKKFNAEQLTNIIIDLEVNKKMTFKEPVDGINFGIEKINWNDGTVLLIGGYGTSIYSCDITEEIVFDEDMKENILNIINEIFKGWRIDSVVLVNE